MGRTGFGAPPGDLRAVGETSSAPAGASEDAHLGGDPAGSGRPRRPPPGADTVPVTAQESASRPSDLAAPVDGLVRSLTD